MLGNNMTVLIVDDEPMIRELLINLIKWEELDMTVVGETGSSMETLELVEQLQPEIVFLDINMPFLSGIDLAELLLKQNRNIKIIVLTGYQNFGYIQKCMKIGVSDYITKPISAEEVVDALLRVKGEIQRCRDEQKEKERLLTMLMDRKKEEGGISAFETLSICQDPFFQGTGAKTDYSLDTLPDKEPVRNKVKEETIDRIKHYIDENACDFTLSLGTVADHFGLNPSYISRLFKQKTKSNFSQYVMRRRIGLAITIMQKEGGKVHEIAEKVGFIDPHYFGICFKRITGKSVSEFKNDTQGS